MHNKVIVKDPFEMPAVDDTTVLVLRECADLVPHCWIWNESVGYLEVVTYSGYDIYVTVKNVGMKENATSGTIFPSCMEFLITAPNATPIIDNTVTCLRADFNCPTVGQEALMSVDSTSAIRVGDIIIVDTRYQYLVTEIINEHTMKVLNEEKGKEGGVIDVKCNECVPVKIFESTHCCEALQEQVDDIYSRIDTKKSVVSNNVLLSVAHGLDAISDVSYDIELDIDTDLSKYDNTVSQFITLGDIPTGNLTSTSNNLVVSNGNGALLSNASLRLYTGSILPGSPVVTITNGSNRVLGQTNTSIGVDTDLSKYDNSVSKFIKIGDVPAQNVYTASAPLAIDNNYNITISQASSTTNGYLSSTDWNTFNNKLGLEHFEESVSGTTASFAPKTSSSATTYDLGSSSDNYDNSFVNYSHCAELININTNIDYIQFSTLSTSAHPINYVAGTTSGNYGKHAFYTGGRITLEVDYEKVNSNGRFYVQDNGVDHLSIGYTFMVPENNTNYSIGINTTPFRSSYITNTYTDNIYNISGTVYINSTVRDSSAAGHNIGDNSGHHFAGVYATGFIQVPSDITKKENINIYEKSILDKFENLNPITYSIKDKDSTDIKFGLSAQELQQVEPLCVIGKENESTKSGNDEGSLGVELYSLITLCVKAIKELSAEVKELKSKLGEKDADSKVLEK